MRLKLATSLLALTVVLSPSFASATDVYSPTGSANDLIVGKEPAKSWAGPYIGIHGGYAWADRQTSLNDGFASKVFDPEAVEFDNEGWLGGVQVGFNAQTGRVVFGLEVDASITDIDGDTLVGTPKYIATDGKDGTAWGIGYEVEYLGTLRGRLGFLVNDALLVYGTGGAAWAQIQETHSVQDGQKAPHATSVVTSDHFGWTAGGGLEWEFKPGWTFKTDYLYVDLGDADYPHDVGNSKGNPDLTSSDLQLHVVRAGVNYRF